MKLTDLSSEYLKFMVKTYSDTHKNVFQFEQFKELHPNLDIPFMSDAIYLLEKDGFVAISSYDNVPYFVRLDVSAIRDTEENTLIKKGYAIAKEIKSWL